MRIAARVVGVLTLAIGLLWIGQGFGLILWPASSFMLTQEIWALWGALLALAGAGLIRWSRRA